MISAARRKREILVTDAKQLKRAVHVDVRATAWSSAGARWAPWAPWEEILPAGSSSGYSLDALKPPHAAIADRPDVPRAPDSK
jgi:hypothetical protein